MKIRVDWFKPTGKWYAGEEVEVGDWQLWEPEFKQAIVDNQKQLVDSWLGDFHVVTGDLQKYDDDPEYSRFSHHFAAERWVGMKKSRTKRDEYKVSADLLKTIESAMNGVREGTPCDVEPFLRLELDEAHGTITGIRYVYPDSASLHKRGQLADKLEQYRNCTTTEAKRLGDELGEMIFGADHG